MERLIPDRGTFVHSLDGCRVKPLPNLHTSKTVFEMEIGFSQGIKRF